MGPEFAISVNFQAPWSSWMYPCISVHGSFTAPCYFPVDRGSLLSSFVGPLQKNEKIQPILTGFGFLGFSAQDHQKVSSYCLVCSLTRVGERNNLLVRRERVLDSVAKNQKKCSFVVTECLHSATKNRKISLFNKRAK